LNNLPAGILIKKIFVSGRIARCVAISKGRTDIPFKEIDPPKMSLSGMNARLKEEAAAIRAIKENMIRHLTYLDTFTRIKKALEKELEFHEALKGMGHAAGLAYIAGYLPFDSAKRLAEKAKEERWALRITDPSEGDMVPTLIRNPGWVSVIKPVLRLLTILPGYREIDISPLFLLFLGLFFGMIIGDAGYGALYATLTFFAQRRFGKKLKDDTIFRLFYFFSSCAIFWGVLTGTVFGQEWFIRAGFKPFVPLLNNTKFLQALCFFIGAFHLTLGHAWQAVRKSPSLTALADVGWIMVLWSAFFFAKMLILNDPLPQFVNPILAAGVFLVILFASPQRNIFKMVGMGLRTLVLSIMNNFTDVVSYVRLFAVGLAGVAISDTVNMLASLFGGDNILLRVMILFLGHTINIVLGPMSVLVHGIRLNVLEFSGHADLTWGGVPYRPLESAEKA
jgi:V/A-type H+-transporting ATPase subunit I